MSKIMVLLLLLGACELSQAKKQIALTFDDAPRAGTSLSSQNRTDMMLEAFAEHGVDEVMFYVTTKHVTDKNKSILDQYVKAGHIIANHSHAHTWLHKTDLKAYQADIIKANDLIKSYATYQPYFRFPYLDEGRDQAKSEGMIAFLKQQGLHNGYVTVDNYDWYLDRLYQLAVKANKTIDREQLKKLYVDVLVETITFSDDVALKYLGRSPKHVLLLHDNDLAAMFIGDLIAELKQQDWEIISPLEAYQDPIAKQEPNTLFKGQGRVAALARDAGAEPSELVHVAEDEDKLYEMFIAYQVADIQSPQIPYWFRKEMSTQVGKWKTSNAAYQSDSEPFSNYLIEWSWGIGKTHINGHLYGLNEGEKTGDFWTFKQYWDPVKNEARMLQFGQGGKVGDGGIKPLSKKQIETIQTFSSPTVEAYLERHVSEYKEGGLLTTSYQLGENKEWKKGRSYLWHKIAE